MRARSWWSAGLGLRVVLVLAGLLALLPGLGGGLTPLVLLIGLGGLAAAAVRPRGTAPAVVLGAAAVAWAMRYGVDPAPVAGTLLVAVGAAVHHQAAALAAVVPPRSRIRREVLLDHARHGGLVLGLTAVVAVLALALGRPGGSVPLEFLGLAAAVLAVTVPVLLGRGGTR